MDRTRMQITLKLVPSTTESQRETMAWFVPGRDARAWLTGLNRGELPLDSIELLPIPRSLSESIPIGVLVTLGSARLDSRMVSMTKPCQRPKITGRPYARIANRLFIPVEARFIPEVNDDDLISLLPADDSKFVWHASTGLVRVEATERLRVVDLLTAPPQRTAVWDRAIPGIMFRSRLISVEAESPLNVDNVVRQGGDDISSRGSSPEDLPPTDDEWMGGKLNRWIKSLRDLMKPRPQSTSDKNSGHHDASKNTHAPSKSGAGPGGIVSTAAGIVGHGLAAMAIPFAAAGAAIGKIMEGTGIRSFIDQVARNREIDRLLNLLNTNPDEGLRFALPVGGGEDRRGILSPSNQLGSHDTIFDLNRLSGGGRVDRWNVPIHQQLELIRRYRELAEREIRLGRHRRAAYIYAELLSDSISAAGTLESGGHFREAAILYRDRLNRPAQAASCLERAGLLDDAALLYITLDMLETAADLYLRLDRPDEAERLFRRYADSLITKGDFRNAGRIFHDKLHDVDGALDALAQSWPHSSSALICMVNTFVLLGVHARHDQAQGLIRDLRNDAQSKGITKRTAEALSMVSVNYPDIGIRALSADAAQVVVAQGLTNATYQETKGLLASIRRLAPEDRLLTRDCDRYVRIRQETTQSKQIRSPKSREIFSTYSDSLPLKIDWRIAKSSGSSVYIAGYGLGQVVLQRLNWNHRGNTDSHAVWPGVSDLRQLILHPFPQDAGSAILHQIGADLLPQRRLTGGQERWALAGSPSWATKSSVALAYDVGGWGWRIREIFGTLELARINPRGDPSVIKDLTVPYDASEINNARVTLFNGSYSDGSVVRIGIGSHLCRPHWSAAIPTIADFQFEPMPYLIESITGFQSWLLVLFDTGGLLIDEDHGERHPVADGLNSPVAIFLSGGQFVIAGRNEVQAYEVVNSRPVCFANAKLGYTPIAVTTTNNVGEFAVFGPNGQIQIFELR